VRGESQDQYLLVLEVVVSNTMSCVLLLLAVEVQGAGARRATTFKLAVWRVATHGRGREGPCARGAG